MNEREMSGDARRKMSATQSGNQKITDEANAADHIRLTKGGLFKGSNGITNHG
jgi:hypothetical protein